MKIVFPELATSSIAAEAVAAFPDVEWLSATSLAAAAELVATSEADSMISGLDYPSRDVILAYKSHLPLKSQFFSSCFICQKNAAHLTIADGGVIKHPTAEQLYTIIEDTTFTHQQYFHESPRIAVLSYSTHGSGGKDPDLTRLHQAISEIRAAHPSWLIDGEMQLDAAVSPTVASKKLPDSPLKGQANILITPDLNSGNILYKSLEQFGGFTVAGPIIQGFKMPLADLSRGSTTKDTILTIKVIKELLS